jgi:hypothetical protein
MDRDAEVEVIRRAYAKQIMAGFGVSDRRIEAAFASVKSEAFLGRCLGEAWGRSRGGRLANRAMVSVMCRPRPGTPCTSMTTWWSASFQSAP